MKDFDERDIWDDPMFDASWTRYVVSDIVGGVATGLVVALLLILIVWGTSP